MNDWKPEVSERRGAPNVCEICCQTPSDLIIKAVVVHWQATGCSYLELKEKEQGTTHESTFESDGVESQGL